MPFERVGMFEDRVDLVDLSLQFLDLLIERRKSCFYAIDLGDDPLS